MRFFPPSLWYFPSSCRAGEHPAAHKNPHCPGDAPSSIPVPSVLGRATLLCGTGPSGTSQCSWDSPCPAEPLHHPTALSRHTQLLLLSPPEQTLQGEKNNARNYSGWQINKLALITLRVSQPPLPRAHQLWRSCSAPAGLVPCTSMGQHPRDPLLQLEPRGHPEVPFQEPELRLLRSPGSEL